MQLSKIKMSGFKSFVDPTTVYLPSHLVAVVGPNGCGKSNIIDAVMWVMGESSPKYLRGEALTDVIFNGSTSRKPVGLASVELIFDNSDGTIKGEYAAFTEISVKRVLNRESEAGYYINGVRSRKRDVLDLFRGTGIGPRSYSIIGQNMVAKLPESKPEEIRSFLEEAAGISKYKDRRHETELRISHTKDNLTRVQDLLSELEKQLSHLKQQANAAEKFKTLKQQERTFQAELYAIEWRVLDTRLVDLTLKIQHEETAFEARQSELITTDREIENLRHEQKVAHDAYQEVQTRYYGIGNEITRIEQDILHHQEKQLQWENDLKVTSDEWQNITDQLAESEDQLHDLEQETETIHPLLKSHHVDMQSAQTAFMNAEETLQSCLKEWETFNESLKEAEHQSQIENMQVVHLEERQVALQKQCEQMKNEISQINFLNMDKELLEINQRSSTVSDQLQISQKEMEQVRKEIHQENVNQQTLTDELAATRSDLQKLQGEQASLLALQETALGERDQQAVAWLMQHQLTKKPRLAQHMEVRDGWELAVEKALGFALQAVCVDDLTDIASVMDGFKSGRICVFSAKPLTSASEKNQAGSLLLEKIVSPWPLDALLGGIYAADSLQEAMKMSRSLKPYESVITKDGIWLHHSWLKVLREEDPAAGVLVREQDIKRLSGKIKSLEEKEAEIDTAIKQKRELLLSLEEKKDQCQQTVNRQQGESAEWLAQSKLHSERLSELKSRAEKQQLEYEESQRQLDQTVHELKKAKNSYQQLTQKNTDFNKDRDVWLKKRDQSRLHYQNSREYADLKKQAFHEIDIRVQTTKSQKSSLEQVIKHLNHQLTALNDRKLNLERELNIKPHLPALKDALSKALDRHVLMEGERNTARVAMESLELEFKNIEGNRQTIEREINRIRSTLENLRVEWQGIKVRSETLFSQIKDTEFSLEALLKDLSQEANIEEWSIKVEQIKQRINRLGAINLIAIEEYSTCLERKQYLDYQINDLNDGLNTLLEAIATIDKETKIRFKETFDKVNEQFQYLFPTIFGGGHGNLELTSDNLLEAGVTVMACPPGKRNSNIYLLSGGEKSLTAIALIFSIFYQNPAPFCLLDEVDAALDDANVLRFGHLLKTMMEKTQFIFISHNKITIEIAEHLIGVTMHEPGVSRLVSVDIEKAMSLAGS